MSFRGRYKYILLSLRSYAMLVTLLLVLFLIAIVVGDSSIRSLSLVFLLCYCIANLVAIYYAYRSIKQKESQWIGSVIIVIEILVILMPIILTLLSSIAFLGFLSTIGNWLHTVL